MRHGLSELFAGDVTVAIAVFDMFQGFASNPSTMMKLRRQQRFKHMPKTICKAVYLNSTVMDVRVGSARAVEHGVHRRARDARSHRERGRFGFHQEFAVPPQIRRSGRNQQQEAHRVSVGACHGEPARAGSSRGDADARAHSQGSDRAPAYLLQGRVRVTSRLDQGGVRQPGTTPGRGHRRHVHGTREVPCEGAATATATSSSYHHTIQTGRAEMAHSRPQPERGAVHTSTGRAKSSAEAEAEAAAANAKTASATEGASANAKTATALEARRRGRRLLRTTTRLEPRFAAAWW